MKIHDITYAVSTGSCILKHLQGTRIELFPVITQSDMTRIAGKQFHPEFLLKFTDLLRYGTLGNEKRL